MTGEIYEDLVFAFMQSNPSDFISELNKSYNKLKFGIKEPLKLEVRPFQRESSSKTGLVAEIPFSLSGGCDVNTMIVHKPLDNEYPNVDGMVEFNNNGKMTLVFLQMSLETPKKHTDTPGKINFFIEEGSEYRALDINWRDLNYVSDAELEAFKDDNLEEVNKEIEEQKKILKEKKCNRKLSRDEKHELVQNIVFENLKSRIKEYKMDQRTDTLKREYLDLENYDKYLVWVVLKKERIKIFKLPGDGEGNHLYTKQFVVDIPTIFRNFSKHFLLPKGIIKQTIPIKK